MVKQITSVVSALAILLLLSSSGFSQGVKLKGSQSWVLTGRAQVQYLVDTERASNSVKTKNGFRIRRGRLQAKGKVSDNVDTKFQIEVRENAATLKDAEGKIKFANGFYSRLGQFKVPIWREELRSSGKLLLAERSAAAAFLADHLLSARHVGVEIGRKSKTGIGFAINVSNGAGEGNREDNRTQAFSFSGDEISSTNNGKLVAGRINVPINKKFQIAVSASRNEVGNGNLGDDFIGPISVISPDFGLYLPVGSEGTLSIEGGAAFGNIDGNLIRAANSGSASDNFENRKFSLFDATLQWKSKMDPIESLGGLDGFEFASGITYIDRDTDIDNDAELFLRFGPAFYFGKQTRIQINGEVTDPEADSNNASFRVRSQATFNF